MNAVVIHNSQTSLILCVFTIDYSDLLIHTHGPQLVSHATRNWGVWRARLDLNGCTNTIKKRIQETVVTTN